MMYLVIFRIKTILLTSLLSWLVGCSTTVQQNSEMPTEPPQAVTSGIDKSLLLSLVNAQRQKGCRCGSTYYKPVNKVVWSETLEKTAMLHSRSMEQSKQFSHTGRDGSTTPQRMERMGYNWMAYGENIYMTSGYTATEQEVIAAWIKSAGHCTNLMSPDFTEMGIAKAGNYWTQVFGKPMPSR